MLPGVEFARRRRLHHQREPQTAAGQPPGTKALAAASFRRCTPLELSSSMSEEAALALLRLDERLRGLPHRSSGRHPAPVVPAPSSSSTSSGRSWLMFRIAAGDAAPSRVTVQPPPPPPPPPQAPPPEASINGDVPTGDRCNTKQRGGGGGGGGGGGRKEVCAVCLEEVEGKQRVTWLPCSHKYHADCILPWLAAHPHCPCCRTPCSNLGITTQ